LSPCDLVACLLAVRELLSRFFAVARTVIGRYGGVVEKFIGDAVMAVWGTPAATEGDAERAVRAALDLVAAVAELGVEAGVPGLAARGRRRCVAATNPLRGPASLGPPLDGGNHRPLGRGSPVLGGGNDLPKPRAGSAGA
jgi:hypothetical protein